MFRNRLYYSIKPLIPVSYRLALRRWLVFRKLEKVRSVWPILPGSERPPQGWPGWPDGKKFALVLTHDVEGQSGYDKIRKLMDLEERLGYRSCFNLIPEGEYRSTPEFRQEIKSRGFEVGVHDLYHDGKLFLNRAEFERDAPKINGYLKDWGAAGFRSGFMLRNENWIHDLNVQYDLSTFDTDPFEPQPHGVGTIFPFWVEKPGHSEKSERVQSAEFRVQNAECRVQSAAHSQLSTLNSQLVTTLNPQPPRPQLSTLNSQLSTAPKGYVELPYTLPQDSTLFLFMQERHADIWFQKLDWVAKHGGMALVNVHPDYMRFDPAEPAFKTFPAEFYSLFLEYARARYGDTFWQPLPSEVARLVASHKLRLPRRPKRVCLAGPLFYESDNRTMRYAEALKERGDEVDVIALRTPGQEEHSLVRGVNVFRIQERVRNEKGAASYLKRLTLFLLRSFLLISRRHLKQPYDFIHIHSIPDFQVFSALVPRLTGAKVLLDIYDVLPEFYLSKFHIEKPNFVYWLLRWQERLSARFAHHVISANHIWQKKLTSRAVAPDKCTPFINYIDARMFSRRVRQSNGSKFVVVYPGILNWHQGVDVAIRAFDIFRRSVPDAEFHIYGDGPEKPTLREIVEELGLSDRVFLKEPVPLADVPQIMANADMGVVGKRNDVFGNEAYSTKILEYMSQGIPAVIPRTAIDSYYFSEQSVMFYEPGNAQDMAEKMLRVQSDRVLRDELVQNGFRQVSANKWESCKKDYLGLVDQLVDNSHH